MTFDSLSESGLFDLEKYLHSNSYRQYTPKTSHIPRAMHLSARSQRLNHQHRVSMAAFQQIVNNRTNSLTLDRVAYKLRMKSDLKVDTVRTTPSIQRRFTHRDPPHHQTQENDAFSNVPSSTTTKTARQPTANTMATKSMKTLVNDEFHGIEGSAVHVGTLNDLIKQCHHEEFRLFDRAVKYFDDASTLLQMNRLKTENSSISKGTLMSSKRFFKPHTLTEYQINVPNLAHSPPEKYRFRMKEKVNGADLPLITSQPNARTNSLERQATVMNARDKRIQESREKILMHTEKHVCNCNKLNIADPFIIENQETTRPLSKQPSARYVFPPVRPFGYFTKKSMEHISHSTPSSIKPVYKTKKIRPKLTKESLESLNQGLSDDDENSQLFNETIKSIVSFSDLEEDFHTSSRTKVNFDLKQSAN